MSGLHESKNERGYAGLLSEVLPRVIHTEAENDRSTGKRKLAKSHIEKLSQRFHVSPELFFERAPREGQSSR
jgi:hypothetical protein